MFVATVVYELDPSTSVEAQKMLRAELVGRRYNDRFEGTPLPKNSVWIQRSRGPDETVDTLKDRSAEELRAAVAAVAKMGLPIRLVRGWIHISGAGTWGPIE